MLIWGQLRTPREDQDRRDDIVIQFGYYLTMARVHLHFARRRFSLFGKNDAWKEQGEIDSVQPLSCNSRILAPYTLYSS